MSSGPEGFQGLHLEALYRLTQAVHEAPALEELYRRALEGLREALRADRVALLLFDPDGVMRFKAWLGLSDRYRAAVEGHSPWSPEEREPRPVLVPDVGGDPSFADYAGTFREEGLAALAFVPLVAGQRLLGKLMVYYDSPHPFRQDEVRLALACAHHVASAIDRRRAEDALLRSQERLTAALWAGRMGTWDFDATSGRVTWSEQVEDIHGLPRGSFPGTFEAYLQDIHPEDRERVAAGLQASMQGADHDLEYRLLRPDGSVVWVRGLGAVFRDAGGRPLRMSGFCMDITDRKRHELLLRGQKEVLEMILRGVPLGEVLERLALLAETQFARPVRVVIRVGEVLDGGDWSVPVRASDGRVLGTLACDHEFGYPPSPRDLEVLEVLAGTAAIALERRKAEQDLLEAKEAADAANAAKTRFLANMSHEIRTPMNGIVGTLDLLAGTQMDPQQQDLLSMIRLSADVLLCMLEDVLDISRAEAGHLKLDPRPFHLPTTLTDCLTLVRETAAARGLTLALETDPQVPAWLEGDEIRVRQVLLNLLNNALKFTPTGSVVVSAALVGREEEAVTVRLSVSDTGIGVPEEALERIFEPFLQADPGTARRFGGTGLGLSISRQIAELMGGRLLVESQEGRGSTFTLEARFPVALPQAAEAPVPVPRGGSLRVLVAEDNPINRRVLLLQLAKLGYPAEAAESGREVLERWREGAWQVILMDCQMPEVDGYEATRRLRGLPGGDAPAIIALTAHAQQGERERCLAAGMDDFLAKPVPLGRLEEILGRYSSKTCAGGASSEV